MREPKGQNELTKKTTNQNEHTEKNDDDTPDRDT